MREVPPASEGREFPGPPLHCRQRSHRCLNHSHSGHMALMGGGEGRDGREGEREERRGWGGEKGKEREV